MWKYSGEIFVSFLAADARRVGQGGEKGEAAFSHTASAKPAAWNSWAWVPDWCGDLIAYRKTKGISRPEDQSGGLLRMMSGPAVLSISLPSHGTEPDLVRQSKATVYIMDFLCEKKLLIGYHCFVKVLYSRRTFRFLFLSTTGIIPQVPRQCL